MKARILTLILILGVGLLNSCSDDDDNLTQQNESINGIWNLKNVSGGLSPINIDYNNNDVIWTFNETTNMLIIENNIMTTGPEQIYSGPVSGTYNYTIQLENENQILLIEGIERGYLILSDNNLKVKITPS